MTDVPLVGELSTSDVVMFKTENNFGMKGQTLFSEVLKLAVQTNVNSNERAACTHCLRPIVLQYAETQIGLGCVRTLDAPCARDIRFSGLVPCPYGSTCNAIFCSEACCKLATGAPTHFGWHLLLCSGDRCVGSGVREFKRYCMLTSETFLLVAIIISRIIGSSLLPELNNFLVEHRRGLPWHTVAARSKLQGSIIQYEIFSRLELMLHEEMSQAWELLMLSWCQVEDTALRALILQVTLELFSELAAIVDLDFKSASVDLTCLIPNSVIQKPENKEQLSLKKSDRHVRVSHSDCASRKSQLSIIPIPIIANSSVKADSCQISHHEETESLRAWEFLVVGQNLSTLKHSCCPNSQIELELLPSGLVAKVIALRDVTPLESLSISFIRSTSSVENRRHNLICQFGIVCSCARCCWECEASPSKAEPTQLHQLALQYLEEDRYLDSEIVLRFILSKQGNADALHHLGQALLGQNKWVTAHNLWHSAARLYPLHHSLKNQVEKDAAYARRRADEYPSFIPSGLSAYVAHNIWTSTQPILSKKRCKRWIDVAERNANMQGGWNTNRHYGVPTTDIPVHTIPELLEDWNELFCFVISPLLSAVISNTNPNRFKVHDAFIVKYDALNGQRFLPVHRDQGQISLTIALNDHKEYEGGGTFFETHGSIVLPDLGHCVVFKSALLHGGAPISSGIRYIIAAFIFHDDVSL